MIILLQYLAHLVDNPQSRGTFGEMIVGSIFDPRFFGNEDHYLVNDVILGTPDGKTHQIDHVVIYKTGVFCIETKNIEGLIVGHPNVNPWKVYVGNNEPHDLFNPIMQNKAHVKVLSEFLEFKYDVHSIIVFVKSNKPKDCGSEVLDLQELKDYVKNYQCDKELTSEQMKEIYTSLTTYKEGTGFTKEEHVDNIKKRIC